MLNLLGGLVLRKGISILLVAVIVIIAAVYLFSNNGEKAIQPETKENTTDIVEKEKIKPVEQPDEQGKSFTFEPFTLTMTTDEKIEVGRTFEVEAALENTYNGPVTLSKGSKCTEEVTFTLIPFSEYAEGQPAPECKNSTEEVELKVGESISTKAELMADKDEPYILSAYFANIPLLKKVISIGSKDFDEANESLNVGALYLDVRAESTFKTGKPVYLTGTLSNKGENFIRMKENSCRHDLEFTVKVNNENVQLPGTYGPCEDDSRSFNLQAGDSMNGYSSFIPEKAGTYSVTVGHVNDIKVELEFDID